MADDAVSVLDAAGVDRAHVYGISLGGMIAQEVALRHPERIRALVLGATTAGGDSVQAAPEVVAWPGAAHLYFTDEPEIDRRVTAWLNERSSPGPS